MRNEQLSLSRKSERTLTLSARLLQPRVLQNTGRQLHGFEATCREKIIDPKPSL